MKKCPIGTESDPMNHVEVIEDYKDHPRDRPFMVSVNGRLLRDKRGVGRRFKCSLRAALAGAVEVDRLRGVR